MKNKTKKLGVIALSLSMAALIGASTSIQIPVQNIQNGGLGNTNKPVNTTSSNILKMSDEFTASLDNTQFFNQNLLSDLQLESLNANADGTRKIIVELESKPQIDLYLENDSLQSSYDSFTSYVNAKAGKSYANLLKGEHDDFFRALNKTSISYELRHTYTSILNGVSLLVNTKDVSKISQLDGVKNIILSEVYAVPQVEPTVNVVDVYGTGIYDSSDVKYKGDGMLVAVLDTGLDIAHNAFKTMPTTEKIGIEDVANVLDACDASMMTKNLTAKDVYYNAKVPFAYDYADKDPDVFAVANSHGVHVAGIIAGQDDTVTGEDDKAFEDGSKFIGVAPNAQLMIGKVFSDKDTARGADTDDILAAVSDCVVVGADVINMSLGMDCGFSREEDGNRANEIYDKVYAAGINLVVAASNSYSSGLGGAYGSTNLTSNPDSSTVGSPSTYYSALSVASISGQKSPYMQLNDGTAVYFNESSLASGQQGRFAEELLNGAKTKEFKFVVVPGYGRASNYNSSVKAALAEGNCIAIVSRGDTSFEEKQRIAYDNGAVGCIIYNNMSGKISASLGTGKKIPTCTVSASIGQKFTQLGKGTITLNEDFKAGPFMSDFSSWGPTNDLKIKPEITAHGGEITSAVVGGYKQYSGTSMASPNMAGAVTLLRQHVAENYGLTGVALATRVNQLLMSTATIVYDENGLPYAVRKQGAGLGDIGKAIATEAFLYVENSTKSKIELGDDPARKGVYTMNFRVKNTSDKVKVYNLDAIAMTESVSIDGITVEEKASMLENAQKSFFVNGQPTKEVTLAAGADVEITLTLSLSASEKAYLDANFENGMYVEGFVTLEDAGEGVDLSIPYLAFYGDWTDAPLFDASSYEVSADKYDSSIKDEDKTVAAVYGSVAIGKAYKEYDEFYLPLGQYLYNMANDADSGVEASVDKIAVGSSYYGIFEFYAMYMGMLRAAGEMDIRVENVATGKVLMDTTDYNVRKSNNAGPSVVEFELDPLELGLMNNEQYKIIMTARPDYESDSIKEETTEFAFFVDYQAPMIRNSLVRYEDNGDGTRSAYLDLELYDNHYPQSIQLFLPISETEADWVTEYPIPVKDSVRDGTSKISINISNYIDNIAAIEGTYANCIGVRVDDYALNAAAYLVSINKTVVDEVQFNYTYKDASKTEVVASLSGETVLLRPEQSVDLSKDMVTIEKEGGNIEGKLSVDMVSYTAYYCTTKDAHGVECGFYFDEIAGYTYKKGDYYYDATTGTVKQKEADDTEATYGAYTRFFDAIATPIVKNGTRYQQPESKHYVCPACGTEEVFGFNTRTGKITTKTFKCVVQDPMIYDVEFTSSNPAVVQVQDGMLYAAGTGTATITAKPSNWANNTNNFVFTVKVEGNKVNSFIEKITVGSVYNHTKNVSRTVLGDGISVDCGSELTLYPDFKPWYVTEISDLTWKVSDPEMAEIVQSSSESARIICKKTGAVAVLLSSPSNGVIGTFTIVIGDEYTLNSYYFTEYKGVGYSETYEENGVTRKMLVIPANLGIVVMGSYSTSYFYDGTFEDVKSIDTVVVPEGVTSIGANCFYGTSIKRIYLPSSMETISSYAFEGTPLQEVYWYNASKDSKSGIEYDADNNTYNWDVFYANVSEKCTAKSLVLHYGAFSGCRSLKVFDTSRVSAMYSSAFSGCVLLEKVDLTKLHYAQNYIFSGCTKLDTVIMDADTSLNGYAFQNTALTEMHYYGSRIEDNMFANMKSLTKVVLYNDIEYVGKNAFGGCNALSSIEWKGECKEIANEAFKNCTALTTITIPAGVEKLGDAIFRGCSNLQTVKVSAEAKFTSIGLDFFDGCTSLKKVEVAQADGASNYNTVTSDDYSMLTNANGTVIIMAPPAYPYAVNGNVFTVPVQSGANAITEIGAYAYADSAALTGKEVIIPEGITTIGDSAFRDTKITKVVIPSTVTEIAPSAFRNCTSLKTVVFLCDIKEISAYTFYNCTSLTNVQLPGSVETVGDYAFMETDIRTLTIGENVRSIGLEAFRNCESLVELNFAEQSALDTIGQAAFAGCISLKTVTMPDTVRVLKNSAFVGCSALTTVYVSAGLEQMEGYVFSACPSITTFTMGDGAKMLGDYAFYTPASGGGFYYHNSLANVTIPDSVEYIGVYAFAGNAVMEFLELNGVRVIAEAAFLYATALEDVVTTDVIETIGANAFAGSGIRYFDTIGDVEYFGMQAFMGTDLYVPNSGNLRLTAAIEIGAGAFYNCKNIKKVTLENAVTIGNMAFGSEKTSSITEVSLGNKLVTMGETVFYNAPISYISLPETLKEIGAPAFTGCSNLSRIVVAEKNKTFFVESNGLYKRLSNGTYELVAVPNNLRMTKIAEDVNELEPFKILEGTSRIGTWAMGHCVYIHAVEIPASVTNIGPYAFFNVGYAVLEANQQLAQTSRVPFTKFIFKGLQAPIMEAPYLEDYTSIMDMYATFVYSAGYLMSDMVIPVNAKGFESLMYQLFFMEQHYSEELIEADTQKLLTWLTGLDVEALTEADKDIVNEMNMIYFMMTSSQKAFIGEELTAKLAAAVEKLAVTAQA